MPSHFIRNSGTLLTGNVVAQGLAFLAYLLLLRLFTPDDFGLCNVFFSYTEVLIILSTCKYEMAIVVAPDDRPPSSPGWPSGSMPSSPSCSSLWPRSWP